MTDTLSQRGFLSVVLMQFAELCKDTLGNLGGRSQVSIRRSVSVDSTMMGMSYQGCECQMRAERWFQTKEALVLQLSKSEALCKTGSFLSCKESLPLSYPHCYVWLGTPWDQDCVISAPVLLGQALAVHPARVGGCSENPALLLSKIIRILTSSTNMKWNLHLLWWGETPSPRGKRRALWVRVSAIELGTVVVHLYTFYSLYLTENSYPSVKIKLKEAALIYPYGQAVTDPVIHKSHRWLADWGGDPAAIANLKLVYWGPQCD